MIKVIFVVFMERFGLDYLLCRPHFVKLTNYQCLQHYHKPFVQLYSKGHLQHISDTGRNNGFILLYTNINIKQSGHC